MEPTNCVSFQKAEFVDSSEDDKVYAKLFWQSLQLLPPMESRLSASCTNQRLKSRPPGPGKQPVNLVRPKFEESPEIVSFLEHGRALERLHELERAEKFSAMRDADRAQLHKQRQARIEKEKISNHKGLPKKKTTEVKESDVGTYNEDEEEHPDTVYQALQQFETKLGQHEELDSD